jgi:uncharacterized protein with HEPN domain
MRNRRLYLKDILDALESIEKFVQERRHKTCQEGVVSG